ncbi:MAG: hypothetical protein J0I06_15545 [Planctomycetes bacterium]|nr:hypothetical protein [Planctomycetota bacterium]
MPPLHLLRASAGEQVVSPVIQIQAMLLNDELPETPDCVNCGCRTDHLMRVSVVCERVTIENQTSGRDALLGCALFGLLGGLVLFKAGVFARPLERGHEISFVLPVRACEACASDRSPAALRRDLCATPVYAALLRRYPNALIARVS